MINKRLTADWEIVAVIVSVVLGTILRVLGLGARDFWYDEAFTGITVRQAWGEMLHIIVQDVHPPLYYCLLKIWTELVGSGSVGLRSFSVLFGVATIILVYLAVKHWSQSGLTATVATIIIASDRFFINYSQEARMYALLGFLLLLALYLLTLKKRFWLGVVLLAILLTHYIGIIFVVGFMLVDVYKKRANLRVYLIPLVGGLAWLPFFIQQVQTHRALVWVPTIWFDHLPSTFHIFLFGSALGMGGVPAALTYQVPWLIVNLIGILIVFGVIILVLILILKRRLNESLQVVGFMAAFSIAMTMFLQLFGQKLFVERYLIGAALFTVIFIVLGLGQFKQKFIIIGGLSVFIILTSLIKPWEYIITYPPVITAVEQYYGSKQIIWDNPGDFVIGRYYAGENNRRQMKILNTNFNNDNLSTWAILDDSDQIVQLPVGNFMLVTTNPTAYPNLVVEKKIGAFSLLSGISDSN
ncbi:MAG: glycosyltransferase family 39 protein [Patescibacteria group bacterium]